MTIGNFVANMPRPCLIRSLLVGLLLTAICGAISAQEDIPTYTEAYIGNVQRLNPLLAPPNSTEAAIATLLFEGPLHAETASAKSCHNWRKNRSYPPMDWNTSSGFAVIGTTPSNLRILPRAGTMACR